MNSFAYDLHLHSCLSPCGDQDMTPANIVAMAALKGLDVIAVTDHNSCKNCPPIMKHAQDHGITAIPGMEICTAEEVHVLCLFPTLDAAMEFDKLVYEKLPKIKNEERIFGRQEICDEQDHVIDTEPYLLISGTDIGVDSLYDVAGQFGGLVIPAHIDKSYASIISNLGFIPPESKFRCLEVKNLNHLAKLKEQQDYVNNCKIISNSDAHYLEHINERVNFIHANSNSIADILQALKNE